MGSLDSIKLLSSLTLFRKANEKVRIYDGNIFSEVINKFFNGREDTKTLNILNKTKSNCYNNFHYINANYNCFKKSCQKNSPYTIKETRKLQKEKKFNNEQNQDGLMEDDYYRDSINSNIIYENKNINLDKQEDDHSLDFYKGRLKCKAIIPGYGQNRNELFYNNKDYKNEFNNYKMNAKAINLNPYNNKHCNIITGEIDNIYYQFDNKKSKDSKQRSRSSITGYSNHINKYLSGLNYKC